MQFDWSYFFSLFSMSDFWAASLTVIELSTLAWFLGMLLGFVLRIVMPQFFPAAYVQWIYLAAACWLGCFSLLGWRLIPFLLAPRVDGKVH